MFEKYRDKTILIVGGGTSTIDRKWENLDYDFVWTCNDFYLEERVLSTPVDLYLLAYTTELSSQRLIDKLNRDKSTVVLEPTHYRRKQETKEYKEFEKKLLNKVIEADIKTELKPHSPGLKAGATFRLVQLAMMTEASHILFVGLDGFNKDFSNIHAFTKHKGLKDTDTRRDWGTGKESYVNVFTSAFMHLASLNEPKRLQNLGEGLEYNLGTPVSKEYFPLRKELYEKLK